MFLCLKVSLQFVSIATDISLKEHILSRCAQDIDVTNLTVIKGKFYMTVGGKISVFFLLPKKKRSPFSKD